MAYISTIISAAASLGVLIGLISGIFFLVLTALRWVSRIRASLYEEELIRQKRFLINKSYLTNDGNSNFPETKRAENEFGNGLNGSNLQRKQDEGFQRNPESSTHGTDVKTSEIEEPNFDAIKVREVIEKMVETMIGGPLDGTTVGQLSTHSSYLDMFTKYHNLLCRELARLGFALHLSVRKNVLELDSTDLKQSNLKRLMKRIVSEAMALPHIKKNLCRPKTSNETENEDFRSKSYEDILATAILNKIIDKFQNENYKVKEKAGGRPRPKLRNKKMNRNDNDDNSDLNFDDDWSDTSRSDQLSLTIEEYIEEITTALEVSDDERTDFSDFEPASNRRIPFPESGRIVVDAGADDENSDFEEETTATELVTSTSSWEENWLFQKKRLRSTPNAHHPVPVPMLVPNPSEDFRALVGGVDADDLSDMSDYSDTVLEDLTTTEEKPKQLLKHDEGPKYLNSEEENRIKKGEESQNQTKGEFPNEKKDILNSNKNSCSQDEKENGRDKNHEVNEHFEQSLSSLNSSDLSQKDRDSSIEDFPHQYATINSNSNSEGTTQNISSTETEDCREMICILAEKEKEKWTNPVPLTDNPYSLENINKRQQQNKNEYFRIGTYTGESINFPEDLPSNEFPKEETEKLRFSRDYYINASKHRTGMISPSINRHSDEYEQNSQVADLNMTLPENKFTVEKMQDKQNKEIAKGIVIDKSQFSLPSVKELAKQFATEDKKKSKAQTEELQTKLESKHKTQILQTNDIREKEPEIDYSSVPVSKIILNLKHAVEAQAQENHHKDITCNQTQATRMEIYRKVDNNVIVENHTESFKQPDKIEDKIEAVRFNGKQIHSLTARSISKEFREGLKNNSYQKASPKINQICSSGESDQGGSMLSNNTKTSPTPSIDLKNIKKFWEEIITANSNSTKQK